AAAARAHARRALGGARQGRCRPPPAGRAQREAQDGLHHAQGAARPGRARRGGRQDEGGHRARVVAGRRQGPSPAHDGADRDQRGPAGPRPGRPAAGVAAEGVSRRLL
ncbi:MAG: integration host factor, partial [uncultured Acidimicrobiales bacterium]